MAWCSSRASSAQVRWHSQVTPTATYPKVPLPSPSLIRVPSSQYFLSNLAYCRGFLLLPRRRGKLPMPAPPSEASSTTSSLAYPCSLSTDGYNLFPLPPPPYPSAAFLCSLTFLINQLTYKYLDRSPVLEAWTPRLLLRYVDLCLGTLVTFNTTCRGSRARHEVPASRYRGPLGCCCASAGRFHFQTSPTSCRASGCPLAVSQCLAQRAYRWPAQRLPTWSMASLLDVSEFSVLRG